MITTECPLRLIFIICLCVFLTGALTALSVPVEQPQQVPIPADVLNPPWLESRQQIQLNTVSKFKVFYDFQFTDRLAESGIRFIHQIVDDAGVDYKPVHYDHGNGVTVADVNGDGLYDTYFTTQLGRNELWKNRGNGKFENTTELAGVGMASRISVTASFADIDNDGDPDLFVTTVRKGNKMFKNDGTGQVIDITEQAGLDYTGHSSSAVL